jgi:hypothetical protein
LGLLPGRLTPHLVECVVRLGSWTPFAPAAAMLAFFTGTRVAEPTVRRLTETAGAVDVAVQTAAVEHLEQAARAVPAGPPVQQVSVDGAMVPLVGGEWAEVKTLAIGRVTPPGRTQELSYFSRLADADTFTRLALVETHRRGTATAGVVCAVGDGAAWVQGFIDYHRPDAVRILDFPHAAESLGQTAQALWGPGTPAGAHWLAAQLHDLKHGDPARVLGKLRGLRDDLAQGAGGSRHAVVTTLTDRLTYLEKRQAQLRYAQFQLAGYPIGSGAVESANKLVVEARLKGSGMHWARAHVTPLVALRTVVCSDRWEEAWPQIHTNWRQQAQAGARRRERPATPPPPAAGVAPCRPAPLPPDDWRDSDLSDGRPAAPASPPPSTGPGRPAADHLWRRARIGRAQREPSPLHARAES